MDDVDELHLFSFSSEGLTLLPGRERSQGAREFGFKSAKSFTACSLARQAWIPGGLVMRASGDFRESLWPHLIYGTKHTIRRV